MCNQMGNVSQNKNTHTHEHTNTQGELLATTKIFEMPINESK